MEDERIIALCTARDETALAEITAKYGARLTRLAMQFLADPADAEECVNETYFKAWNGIPAAQPSHLYAYLAKICRYTAFGMIDKQNAAKRSAALVELTAEMEQCIPDAAPDAAEERLAEVLNAFLGTLTPEKRSLFLRRYWYGESIGELAARYHSHEGRIKTTLYRIRGKLKQYLEKEGIL